MAISALNAHYNVGNRDGASRVRIFPAGPLCQIPVDRLGTGKMVKWIFRLAGIYGLLVLTPLYFLEDRLTPPPSHPEQYYGFLGVGIAWQLAYLVISTDPGRYRLLMLPGIVSKVTWAGALAVLFAGERIAADAFWLGQVDWLLAALFLYAFLRTPRQRQPPAA
jgi:hypothetical protein